MAALGRKLRTLEGGRVAFWCPGCSQAHAVWVEDNAGRPMWFFDRDIAAPTFSPSIMVNRPGQYHNIRHPVCHSYVTKGRILFLQDCTHALAGQTVDLPDWPQGGA
jgi:hypothetical protein